MIKKFGDLQKGDIVYIFNKEDVFNRDMTSIRKIGVVSVSSFERLTELHLENGVLIVDKNRSYNELDVHEYMDPELFISTDEETAINKLKIKIEKLDE